MAILTWRGEEDMTKFSQIWGKEYSSTIPLSLKEYAYEHIFHWSLFLNLKRSSFLCHKSKLTTNYNLAEVHSHQSSGYLKTLHFRFLLKKYHFRSHLGTSWWATETDILVVKGVNPLFTDTELNSVRMRFEDNH